MASRGLFVHVCLADNSLSDSFFYHRDSFFEVGDAVLAQSFDKNPRFWVLSDLKGLALLFSVYQVGDVFQVYLHEGQSDSKLLIFSIRVDIIEDVL